jgi:hypothetical protein
MTRTHKIYREHRPCSCEPGRPPMGTHLTPNGPGSPVPARAGPKSWRQKTRALVEFKQFARKSPVARTIHIHNRGSVATRV